MSSTDSSCDYAEGDYNDSDYYDEAATQPCNAPPASVKSQCSTANSLQEEIDNNRVLLTQLRQDPAGHRHRLAVTSTINDKASDAEVLEDFAKDIGVICNAALSVVTYAEVVKALVNAEQRSKKLDTMFNFEGTNKDTDVDILYQINPLKRQYEEALKFYKANCSARNRMKVVPKTDITLRVPARDVACKLIAALPADVCIKTERPEMIAAKATKKQLTTSEPHRAPKEEKKSQEVAPMVAPTPLKREESILRKVNVFRMKNKHNGKK